MSVAEKNQKSSITTGVLIVVRTAAL